MKLTAAQRSSLRYCLDRLKTIRDRNQYDAETEARMLGKRNLLVQESLAEADKAEAAMDVILGFLADDEDENAND